jgi:hypothetical protein
LYLGLKLNFALDRMSGTSPGMTKKNALRFQIAVRLVSPYGTGTKYGHGRSAQTPFPDIAALIRATLADDLPPLKWSSLKYVFRMEDKIDGKEEAYGRRDRCEVAAG